MQDRTTQEQTTTVDEIPDRTRSSSVGNEDINGDGRKYRIDGRIRIHKPSRRLAAVASPREEPADAEGDADGEDTLDSLVEFTRF